MSNFFYDYMTEEEREIEQSCMQDSHDLKKIQYAAESAVMAHEVRLTDIETKALLENYTDDELEMAYSRELEVYTESVGDLLNKLIEKLKNIWYSLTGQTEKIIGAKIDKDEKIEVPADPSKVHQALIHAGNIIKDFTSLKKKDGSINWKGVITDSILAGATGTGLAFMWKKHNENMNAINVDGKGYIINAKEAPGWIQKIDDAAKKMIKHVEKHKAQKENGEDVRIITQISDGIIIVASKVVKGIATALRKIGAYEADPDDVGNYQKKKKKDKKDKKGKNESNEGNQSDLRKQLQEKHGVKNDDDWFKENKASMYSYYVRCVNTYQKKDEKDKNKDHFIRFGEFKTKKKEVKPNDYADMLAILKSNKNRMSKDDVASLANFEKFVNISLNKMKTVNEYTVELEYSVDSDGNISEASVIESSVLSDGHKETTITECMLDKTYQDNDDDGIESLYESYDNELTSLNDLIALL